MDDVPWVWALSCQSWSFKTMGMGGNGMMLLPSSKNVNKKVASVPV